MANRTTILKTLTWLVVLAPPVLVLYAFQTLDTLEMRTLAFDLGILASFGGLFLLGLFDTQNRRRISRRWTLPAGVILFFLVVTWMQYASVRPSAPLSIVVMTANVFVLVGFLGILTRQLLDVGVFGEFRLREKVARLLVLLLGFVMLFGLVARGIAYALAALVLPVSISVTPEIVQYVLPTITAALMIGYRLSSRLKIISMETVHRIAEDAIFASFAIFAYVASAAFVGAGIMKPLGEISSNSLLGLGTGILAVCLEWYLTRVKANLGAIQGSREAGSIWNQNWIENLLSRIFEEDRQASLSAYLEPSRKQRPNNVTKWAGRVGFSIFGRRIRGTVVLSFLLLGLLVLVIILYIPVQQTLLVPGWKASLSIHRGPLPSSVRILLSDEIEFKGPTSYVVPLVHVSTGNASFVAPLNSRYVRVNSSQFMVVTTGDYLRVEFIQVPVLAKFTVARFPPVSSDQQRNSAFGYLGIFRDVEAYYAMYLSGYLEIVSLCTQSTTGTVSTISKTVYANSTDGRHLVMTLSIKGETIPMTDDTVIESLDILLTQRISNLLLSAKVATSIRVVTADPAIPFNILPG